MTYITETYYRNTFQGEPVAAAGFPSLCQRAAEIVEEMTMYRLTEDSFKMMPKAVQERVKKAVCAQIEYLDANGGSEMDNGTGLSSASLGKFSYSGVSGAAGDTDQSVYAPRAQRLLAPTGLLYRGGGGYAGHT